MADIAPMRSRPGMLVSAACVEAVADALRSYSGRALVVDHGDDRQGGAMLLDESGIEAMKRGCFRSPR